MPITVQHGDPTSIGRGLNQAAFEKAAAELDQVTQQMDFKANQNQLDRDFRRDESQLGREHQLNLQEEGSEDRFELQQFMTAEQKSARAEAKNKDMALKGWSFSPSAQKANAEDQRKIALLEKDQTLQPQNKAIAIAGLKERISGRAPDVRPEDDRTPGKTYFDERTGMWLTNGRDGVAKLSAGEEVKQEREKEDRANVHAIEMEKIKQGVKAADKAEKDVESRRKEISSLTDRINVDEIRLSDMKRKRLEFKLKSEAGQGTGDTAKHAELQFIAEENLMQKVTRNRIRVAKLEAENESEQQPTETAGATQEVAGEDQENEARALVAEEPAIVDGATEDQQLEAPVAPPSIKMPTASTINGTSLAESVGALASFAASSPENKAVALNDAAVLQDGLNKIRDKFRKNKNRKIREVMIGLSALRRAFPDLRNQ